MDIKINYLDIVEIHRLPTRNEQQYKTIVKFHFNETKFNLLKNSKKLKHTNIYINEHFTKVNSEIYYRARHLRKYDNIFNCWTVNGDTFIQNKEKDKKIQIKSLDQF